MGESNVEAASVISDIVRTIFSVLDRPAYWLLGIMYQLFFNVASADLFSNDTIMKFYGRVQLILGVFMMFKLALIILKGIVEPEGFFGGKKGDSSAGGFITKVITGLIILTLMMPISIPGASNEYEIQINNNGILFGTLYSLQHRLLANNTLGRFILGNDDMAEDYTNDTDELKKSARIFTSSILKGFYRINLLPEDERPKHEDGKDDAVFNDNRVCKDIDDDVLKAYTRLDADPGEIISMVNLTCEGDSSSGGAFNSILGVISPKLAGKTYYVFSYMPFISMIVPLIFVFILLSFTIDVAVRAVKLAVLRLIAPIPIISYMDPKGSKDSAFNSWVKTLTSTYLDLFIRLAAVYFAIYLIQDMIVNGVVINHGSGVIGIISLILIWIGIFVFAKQAPKFIKDVLGLKGDSGKLFGGIGEALALGAAAGGIIGSAATGYRAAKEENVELHPNSSFNGLRNVGAAVAGAIGGGVTGVKAFMGKDASAKSVIAAQNQRNAMRAAHSTLGGRMMSTGYNLFTGESLSTHGNNEIKAAQDWVKAQGDWKSALEGEAKINGSDINIASLIGASSPVNVRYEELERAVASSSDGKVRIRGVEYDSNLFTQSVMDDALKDQVRQYQAGHTKTGGKSYVTLKGVGQKLYKKYEDVERARKGVPKSAIPEAVRHNFEAYRPDDIDTFGAAVGAANALTSKGQNDMRQVMRNANDQAKK